MNKLISLVLVCTLLFSVSCKKQKVYPTKYLTFNANPAYTGSHPTTGLVSNIYIQDKGDYMQFLVDIIGGDVTKTYKLHIHAADSTQPYGYSGNPVIDLGTMVANTPVSSEVRYLSFTDFTENFKGYYIVHDPDNINNDTTTLLVYGKIGSWE